jgi:hypothetical protein
LYQELYEKLTGLAFVPCSYPAEERIMRIVIESKEKERSSED